MSTAFTHLLWLCAALFCAALPARAADPDITAAPQSRLVVDGVNATLQVTATGTAPLNYQWQFNGQDLPGATSAALTLTNVSAAQAGSYSVTVSNAVGVTSSPPAVLSVDVLPPYLPGALIAMTYNVEGNGATNWSTNTAQVQAIGRQLRFLKPDVVTFNEIPNNFVWEMTNFINCFLPGYALATNSGTDGFIRSAIASRFPITRSQKWLDGVGLASFGYGGNFTRDLFEAEIAVPEFPLPLHVFVTHLKATSSSDFSNSVAKRSAEASCISNFFVTNFLALRAGHPYLLAGDLNEDVNRPTSGSGHPIERLANPATGMTLTTPVNPFTGDERTWSIQAGSLTVRFDYVLPGGLLASNIATSQVFRTDRLVAPPPPLLTNDSKTASDHLPVVMVFNNPFNTNPPVLNLLRAGGNLLLAWPTTPVGFQLEVADELTDAPNWLNSALSPAVVGGVTNLVTLTNLNEQKFYRLRKP